MSLPNPPGGVSENPSGVSVYDPTGRRALFYYDEPNNRAVIDVRDTDSLATLAFGSSRPGFLNVDILGNLSVSGSTSGILPLTTNGDLLYYNGGATRLGRGTAGQVLTMVGGFPAWAAAGGGGSPLTTNGDLYYYNGGNDRLGIGINGQVLTVNGTLPQWTTQTAGSIGAAPDTESYVTVTPNSLAGGRVIGFFAGEVTVTDNGAGSTVDFGLANTGPGAGAIANPDSITLDAKGRVTAASAGVAKAPLAPEYVVMSLDATLTNERNLAVTSGHLSLTDNGAGASVDLGLPNVGPGAAAYASPDSLTLDNQGRVTAVTAGVTKAPASSNFIAFSADVNLTAERVLTAGTNITLDVGTPGLITINAAGGGGSGGTVQGSDNTYDIEAVLNAGTAGDPRGENSVDLQTDRSLSTQVASGTHCGLFAGHDNTSAGTYSMVAAGNTNNADGECSFVAGSFSTDIQTSTQYCAAVATDNCLIESGVAGNDVQACAVIAADGCNMLVTSSAPASQLLQCGIFASLDSEIENDLTAGNNDARQCAIIASEDVVITSDDGATDQCAIIACETQPTGSNIEGGTHCLMAASVASKIGGSAPDKNVLLCGNASTELDGCDTVLTFGEVAMSGRTRAVVLNTHSTTATTATEDGQIVMRANSDGSGDAYLFYTSGSSSGTKLTAGATSWSSICDRDKKNIFSEVDYLEMVEKARSVPTYHFNYKEDENEVPHMGCTAQDFDEAYGLDDDPLHITMLSYNAVNQATIKGVIHLVDELRAEVEVLKSRIAELENK